MQTSGFIPPGKKVGQLEVYNIENREGESAKPSYLGINQLIRLSSLFRSQGPWNIAGLDDKSYSYHWVEWKDIDDDGLKDVLTARLKKYL